MSENVVFSVIEMLEKSFRINNKVNTSDSNYVQTDSTGFY